MSKTIMAVGAHTGDAQLTSGMLLAKQAMRGDKVIIVTYTQIEEADADGWKPNIVIVDEKNAPR